MIESIALSLVLKKVQIALIASGIIVASALSVYNLPWDSVGAGAEWKTLNNAVRKLSAVVFRLPWMHQVIGSSAEIESGNCKTVIN